MQGLSGSKVLFISGAAVLTLLLYLAPKKSMKPARAADVKQPAFDIGDMMQFQENTLKGVEKQKNDAWKRQLKQDSGGHLGLYDSLAGIWDAKNVFALSGYYYSEKAGHDGTEASYLQAAYRYFDAYKQAVDSTVRTGMVSAAIKAYSKVLEINPHNNDAKTDLGVLYAEATPQPMKGIMLLREVVQDDPNHENAQLNLGILSVKSQQYEKALQRFDKVMEIDPKRTDVLLMKAQVYVETGDRAKAVEMLEQYKKAGTDQHLLEEADKMIEKLK